MTSYIMEKSLADRIDDVLKNIHERNPVRLRNNTPDVLVDNGVKNLPMYENPSHVRKNILTEQEATKLGLSINKSDHYHGLGKELYIKVISSLDNPRVIFRNKNKNNEFLILTMIKDIHNNNIIIPIEVETTTSVNNMMIDINRIKTIYGYNRTQPNLNKYIKDNLSSKKIEKIYEQKIIYKFRETLVKQNVKFIKKRELKYEYSFAVAFPIDNLITL